MEKPCFQLLWSQEDNSFFGYFENILGKQKTNYEIHFDQETGLYTAFKNYGSHPLSRLSIDSKSNLAEMKQLTQHYFMYDELTLVYRREYFLGFLLENEIHLAIKNNRPISLLYADIDNMKCLNQYCGHQQGDAVIYSMASIMRKLLRQNDMLARVSGDEFVILMPESDLEEAETLSKQIKLVISSYPLPKPAEKVSIFSRQSPNQLEYIEFQHSLSIGVSCLQELKLKRSKELLELAEERSWNDKMNRTRYLGPEID